MTKTTPNYEKDELIKQIIRKLDEYVENMILTGESALYMMEFVQDTKEWNNLSLDCCATEIDANEISKQLGIDFLNTKTKVLYTSTDKLHAILSFKHKSYYFIIEMRAKSMESLISNGSLYSTIRLPNGVLTYQIKDIQKQFKDMEPINGFKNIRDNTLRLIDSIGDGLSTEIDSEVWMLRATGAI